MPIILKAREGNDFVKFAFIYTIDHNLEWIKLKKLDKRTTQNSPITMSPRGQSNKQIQESVDKVLNK